MSQQRISYRKLRHYKYQLVEDYTIQIDIRPANEIGVPNFIVLTTSGQLTIQKRYAWDGPSGPTVDTKDFMRGSLVHDALYQMMRERLLSQEDRRYADDLLRAICLEDGMPRFRAWYVHKAVRWFGAFAARPSAEPPDETIFAP